MTRKMCGVVLLVSLSVSVFPAHAGLCESLLAAVASRLKFEGPPAWHNKTMFDEESAIAENDPSEAEKIPRHFVAAQVDRYVAEAKKEGVSLATHVLLRPRTLYMEDLSAEHFGPGSLIVVNSDSGLVHAFFRPPPESINSAAPRKAGPLR